MTLGYLIYDGYMGEEYVEKRIAHDGDGGFFVDKRGGGLYMTVHIQSQQDGTAYRS